MEQPIEQQGFNEWAKVEVMGHRRLAGKVSEQTIAGAGFIRIDVPKAEGDGFEFTCLFSPSSIYAITPVSEDVARKLAAAYAEVPVARYEMREQPALSASTSVRVGEAPWNDADDPDE